MRKPNMARVVARWESPYLMKSVAIEKVDFVETTIVTVQTQNLMIQVADKEKLNPESIDWSREYILIHSRSPLMLGKYVEYKNKDFKLVSGGGDWSDYGYYEIVGEETKLQLLVETPED